VGRRLQKVLLPGHETSQPGRGTQVRVRDQGDFRYNNISYRKSIKREIVRMRRHKCAGACSRHFLDVGHGPGLLWLVRVVRRPQDLLQLEMGCEPTSGFCAGAVRRSQTRFLDCAAPNGRLRRRDEFHL
jgi:hypothetical protein